MTTGTRIRRGHASGVAGSLAAAGAVAVLDGVALDSMVKTGAFWTASGTTVDTSVQWPGCGECIPSGGGPTSPPPLTCTSP